MKQGDKFKIDSYQISQYENKRVVGIATIYETPKKTDKKVLCHIDTLNAHCLVFKRDLKNKAV